MAETIEQKLAQAVLQLPIEINVGTEKYTIAPPSVATLILASEAVSRLPHIKLDPNKVVEEALCVAKECRPIGEVVAILILGARHLEETVVRREKKPHRLLWGLIKWETEQETEVRINKKEELTDKLLDSLTPEQLYLLLAQILTKMQIQDFFGLTTFLTEVNLLRPTKVD